MKAQATPQQSVIINQKYLYSLKQFFTLYDGCIGYDILKIFAPLVSKHQLDCKDYIKDKFLLDSAP
jgi:hypothetical protein